MLQSSSGRILRVSPAPQEAIDPEAKIHRPTVPSRDRRAGVDDDLSILMLPRQFTLVADGMSAARRDAIEALAVRLQETNRTIVQDLDHNLTLMHGCMVKPTQNYEIG